MGDDKYAEEIPTTEPETTAASDTPPQVYRVERKDTGCANCGAGDQFTIVGPGEVEESTSYGDEDEANDVCEMMNEAFAKGVASVLNPSLPSL